MDNLTDEQRQALSEQIASVGRTELESMIWHREMALRAERAAHQATRAELDELVDAANVLAVWAAEYMDSDSVDLNPQAKQGMPRYKQALQVVRVYRDAARAGQEATNE